VSPTDNIKLTAEKLNLTEVVDTILADGRFQTWSGSDSLQKHHYGKGGLALHTWEVIQLGQATIQTLNLTIDPVEWFLAAFFHDLGKMFDYEPVPGSDLNEWRATEYKRLIHHVARSAVLWSKASVQHLSKLEPYGDQVLHAILAHHGQREWGSPVAPKSKVAWLLHLCDSLSARMNDCERLDYLKFRQEQNKPK
jgi:3'-5' exoribonuclease